MRPILRLSKRAEAHLRHAADWYETKRAGRGDEFIHDVGAKLEHIRRWPEAYPAINGDVRPARLLRFPYKVLYLSTETSIEVLAVHHERRDPIAWNQGESP